MILIVALFRIGRSIVYRPLGDPFFNQCDLCAGKRVVFRRHLHLAVNRSDLFDQETLLRLVGHHRRTGFAARQQLGDVGHIVIALGFRRLMTALAFFLKKRTNISEVTDLINLITFRSIVSNGRPGTAGKNGNPDNTGEAEKTKRKSHGRDFLGTGKPVAAHPNLWRTVCSRQHGDYTILPASVLWRDKGRERFEFPSASATQAINRLLPLRVVLASFQRSEQGQLVGVLQPSPHGKSLRQTGHLHRSFAAITP